MNQCVCITLVVKAPLIPVRELIQKSAQKLAIEGIGNILAPHTIKIVAHGSHDAIDEFIDALYTGCNGIKPASVAVEPFVKDRDYRGVFRIIS